MQTKIALWPRSDGLFTYIDWIPMISQYLKHVLISRKGHIKKKKQKKGKMEERQSVFVAEVD